MNAEPRKDAIKVLVVEDAFDQSLVMRSFLASAAGDFQVTHAQDGDHAASLLREGEWGLLITDLNLPGLDGIELCRVAKAAHPSLPILAITGYTGAQYQEEAFRAGATDLILKPIEQVDFVRRVGELTGTPTEILPRTVVAVEGLVGDVEMGCGGALLKHREAGLEVVIVPLCRDENDEEGTGLTAATRAAEAIGARLLLDEAAMDDTERRVALLSRIAEDLRPELVYVPAMDDGHASRREAFRISKSAFGKVPLVLGYQTATTGMEFRPTRMEDVADQMMDKMELLTAYQGAGAGRMDLAPRLAQAYARYWGRLEGFGEVEAFEVVQGR